MALSDPTVHLVERKGFTALIPWLLLLLALAGGGYFFLAVHRPVADELQKKEAALIAAARTADAQKKELDAANESRAQLQKAADEVKQAREDLAKSAMQRSADQALLDQLKKQVGAVGGEVSGADGQITVTMVDKILFKSGESDLTPEGQELLRRLGGVFKSADKLIEVCGHADNTKVQSERKELFPTNWELSTARATNVVRFLQDDVGVKPRRLMAAGFGSYRPIASNATSAGRAKNRRIEILLLPDKLKVVKGDFSDELAEAKAAPSKKTAAPHASDRDRVSALAASRAKQQLAKKKR